MATAPVHVAVGESSVPASTIAERDAAPASTPTAVPPPPSNTAANSNGPRPRPIPVKSGSGVSQSGTPSPPMTSTIASKTTAPHLEQDASPDLDQSQPLISSPPAEPSFPIFAVSTPPSSEFTQPTAPSSQATQSAFQAPDGGPSEPIEVGIERARLSLNADYVSTTLWPGSAQPAPMPVDALPSPGSVQPAPMPVDAPSPRSVQPAPTPVDAPPSPRSAQPAPMPDGAPQSLVDLDETPVAAEGVDDLSLNASDSAFDGEEFLAQLKTNFPSSKPAVSKKPVAPKPSKKSAAASRKAATAAKKLAAAVAKTTKPSPSGPPKKSTRSVTATTADGAVRPSSTAPDPAPSRSLRSRDKRPIPAPAPLPAGKRLKVGGTRYAYVEYDADGKEVREVDPETLPDA
ncbi:hypothetical protein DFP72DRAFT_920333 [Ephemerocybe angulata]|uniref:Uncharacterized protein n=1 Tax=Ephemerocybe angulata TaxID=980116 RepID=A0A8H6HJ03_9AGAR|nr:hypothetical protein DFP72DRAFT_920333 [Tulosesus angulatus]